MVEAFIVGVAVGVALAWWLGGPPAPLVLA